MKTVVICTGIKASKGEFKNDAGSSVEFDSTTFYLNVDLDGSRGKTIGTVSRPFKFGDSHEIEKWEKLDKAWPAAGLPVEVEFIISAGANDGAKLKLKSIAPAAAQRTV
ncbi:hypothetical protein SAMN02745117_01642 [Lampropedia hyalina DSM 16112]|jgi:hypothetical protein|uniref:Uncharacterized protein n=1 Tax=Lampropedia hyalina DSM 16112 TaxID=1122156 RepID=A0A1M5AD11_9BURK|nr:hypothetical protein [Lampropedia hyalina]SHF27926.1 hypothetical protein SAMN02745117_01642 [Lampropedia hyalina DSM 16112]